MQEFIRQYGRYAIAVLAFVMVMGFLASAAIFPQYGLLSYLGRKSQLEADHIDGDYTITKDQNNNEIALYENEDINFDLVLVPELKQTYYINYNKAKTYYPDYVKKSFLKSNKDNATITLLSIKNNNGEDAANILSSDGIHNQVEYKYYDYTDASDNLDNYKFDDGTIAFYEPGIYAITLEAKWSNGSDRGYSTRQKIFKINIIQPL